MRAWIASAPLHLVNGHPGAGNLAEHVFVEIALGVPVFHRDLVDHVHPNGCNTVGASAVHCVQFSRFCVRFLRGRAVYRHRDCGRFYEPRMVPTRICGSSRGDSFECLFLTEWKTVDRPEVDPLLLALSALVVEQSPKGRLRARLRHLS
jgi:hypothetical protein